MSKARRFSHDKDHKDLRKGDSPAEVLRHVLEWHLKGATFLETDIINILKAHGMDEETAEQVLIILKSTGKLRPIGRGLWQCKR